MRSTILILAGLALVAASVPPEPANAAGSFNCTRAATIFGNSPGGRGPRVQLVWRVAEPVRLEALLRRQGWEKQIGEADAIEISYTMPSRYLLMASRKGCRVAHVFLEEDDAKALMAE